MLLRMWMLLLLAFGLPAQAQEMRAAAPEVEQEWPEPPRAPLVYLTVPGVYADLLAHPDELQLAQHLAEHAATAVPRIARELGVQTGHTMRVLLAHDEQDFRELQPGRPPEWADGTAFPSQGLIFLRAPRIRAGTAGPLEQVFDHEIVHVLLGQAFGPRPVPRWLQEGLAQWIAGEYKPETVIALNRGSAVGGLIRLEELSAGFPENAVRAQLAYAQSADLIAFLQQEHGPEAIQVLVAELSQGTPVNAAFRAATGESVEELDRAWRSRLQESSVAVAALLLDSSWWMVPAALALVWGAWMARRRNRVRLSRWEREEALQEAMAEVVRELPPRRTPPPPPFLMPGDDRWVH